MVGSTLSVSLASVDPSTASVYTYQWYRVDGANTTPISGATGSTYVVVESDLDKAIYVVIDADESNGFTGTEASEKTTTVIDALAPTDSSMFVSTFPGTLNAGAYEVVYNANSYEVTVNVADGYNNAQHIFGDITVKYNGTTTPPKNAGTYNITLANGSVTVSAK